MVGFIAESFIGVGFYFTSLLVDALVDGDSELSLIYTGLIVASLTVNLLTRDLYQILNAELFVAIREGLSGLLYKKSLLLGLRSVS